MGVIIKKLYDKILNFQIPILNSRLTFKEVRKLPTQYREEVNILKSEVFKKTSFLPTSFSISQRLKYVEFNMTEEKSKCPLCDGLRVFNLKKRVFKLTCGRKDSLHKNYIYDHIKKTRDNTNLKKYGLKSYTSTDEFKEKSKKTILKKYGVYNVFKSKDIQQKIKEIKTRNKKPDLLDKINFNKYQSKKGFINIYSIQEDYSCSVDTIYRKLRMDSIDYKKRSGSSNPENEIVTFIRSLDQDTEIIKNSRQIIKPKELDIYLPEYKLAIEYNGLMFHSQGISHAAILHKPNLDKNIHLNKTKACEVQGIQLLHINENEWLNPKLRVIWKSVIKNKLNKNTCKLGARECKFASLIQLKNSKQFLDENHLQGAGAIGNIRYGLTYKEELVALMTFSKARFSKADYELVRFSIKKDYTVMGAASKLLKAFKKEYKGTIVSYANRRWSDGNLYKALGFELINTSPPNFYVFHPSNKSKLWHRVSFQKHKLQDKLPNFDDSKTAEWNIFKAGYRKIYDSGNYVFLSKP